MNALLPIYVNTETFVRESADKLKDRYTDRNDRGAGFVEYAALIVVAAVLLVALWKSGLADAITSKVKAALDKLFSSTPVTK